VAYCSTLECVKLVTVQTDYSLFKSSRFHNCLTVMNADFRQKSKFFLEIFKSNYNVLSCTWENMAYEAFICLIMKSSSFFLLHEFHVHSVVFHLRPNSRVEKFITSIIWTLDSGSQTSHETLKYSLHLKQGSTVIPHPKN
jgi:hypothetical protein